MVKFGILFYKPHFTYPLFCKFNSCLKFILIFAFSSLSLQDFYIILAWSMSRTILSFYQTLRFFLKGLHDLSVLHARAGLHDLSVLHARAVLHDLKGCIKTEVYLIGYYPFFIPSLGYLHYFCILHFS